jgi:xylulose-5-phosphate/fructose-6-phosphate phosphoketolase
MVMLNDLDRYHLAIDAIDRVPSLEGRAVVERQELIDERAAARRHTRETGADLPAVSGWEWSDSRPGRA